MMLSPTKEPKDWVDNIGGDESHNLVVTIVDHGIRPTSTTSVFVWNNMAIPVRSMSYGEGMGPHQSPEVQSLPPTPYYDRRSSVVTEPYTVPVASQASCSSSCHVHSKS